jgi:hypothetical protein
VNGCSRRTSSHDRPLILECLQKGNFSLSWSHCGQVQRRKAFVIGDCGACRGWNHGCIHLEHCFSILEILLQLLHTGVPCSHGLAGTQGLESRTRHQTHDG